MANYTQTNIYRKQMKELNLNTQQYAKLIDMPYEVVKDIIYDKEGNYSMEIKNLFRKNMIEKHQEIENNIENAKFQAMEIKQKEKKEINYFDWYENEYTINDLKEKLKLSSVIDIERNYDILVDNKKASHWIYTILLSKKEYDGHYIKLEKKLEFITQLYDILVNDNAQNYISKNKFAKNENIALSRHEKEKVLLWYRKFDFKKYLKEKHLNCAELSQMIGISPSTMHYIVNNQKKRTSLSKQIIKVYTYIKTQDAKQNINDIRETTLSENTSEIEESNDKNYDIVEEKADYVEDDNNATMKLIDNVIKEEDIEKIKEQPQVFTMKQEDEIINSNDTILRKLLADRLTEEEKELIRIFGGKIC